MSEYTLKVANQQKRANRVRAKLHGTAQRPRLSVKISNRHISAQLIDDDAGTTLAAAATSDKDAGTMTEKAAVIGGQIAKAATAKKVKQVVFDRGSRLYHGRIKALAEAARAEGLEF